MKRKAVAGLLVFCLTSALTGCGKEAEAYNSTDSTETTPEVTEEPEPEAAEPTEEPEEEEQQITLPEDQDLVADYTSAEGIQLEGVSGRGGRGGRAYPGAEPGGAGRDADCRGADGPGEEGKTHEAGGGGRRIRGKDVLLH